MDITALSGTYDILDGAESAGTLEVAPQGGYLRFRARCRLRGRELLRLAAACGDRSADLGILAPEGGLWCLDRRFSPAALQALGVEKIDSCFLRRPSPEGWTPEEAPGRLFTEALLRKLCAPVRGALIRREAGQTQLALPLTQPFPLLPVFCLGTLRLLEGKPYLLFGIFEGKPGMISKKEGRLGAVSPKTDETGVNVWQI